MSVFSDFSPDVEAISLDEAFLDMSGSEELFGDPESIGRRLGSLADITARSRHVRFTPDSGHSSVQVGCPESAKSRHTGCSVHFLDVIGGW